MSTDLNYALGTVTNDPDNSGDFSNPERVNDGDLASSAVAFSVGAYHNGLIADLGVAATVDTMEVDYRDSGADHPGAIEHSDDGSSWTTWAGTWSLGGAGRVFTPAGGSVTKRYFRGYAAGPSEAGNFITWYTWLILGSLPPTPGLVCAFHVESPLGTVLEPGPGGSRSVMAGQVLYFIDDTTPHA